MAQGTRGRWVRGAAAGLGVLLCTGLVGCMNTDKDKKDKLATKQPGPGLPGTPPIGANGQSITKTGGAPAFGAGASGSGIQQTGGITPQRYGSTGSNSLTSPPQTFGNTSAQPGSPGTIGAPASPIVPSVYPSGSSPIGAASPSGGFGSIPSNLKDPLVSNGPAFLETPPLPPPPPGSPTASGTQLAVQPPLAPGPLSPASMPPAP